MADAVQPGDLAAMVTDLAGMSRPSRRPFPTVGETTAAFRRLAEPQRAAKPPSGHAWVPGELAHLGETWWNDHIHWYVVVDDIEGDVTVLSVSSWPTLDSRHRLTFDDTTKHEPNVVTSWLHEILEKCRTSVTVEGELAALSTPIRGVAREMRTRSVRVGDVYAFSNPALHHLRSQGNDWTQPILIVFDVTAHARDEAKIAFYAAASGSLEPEMEADRTLAEVTWAERERAVEEGQPEQYA